MKGVGRRPRVKVRVRVRVRVRHPKKLASKSSRSPAVGTSSTAPSIAKAPLLYSASSVPPVASSTC